MLKEGALFSRIARDLSQAGIHVLSEFSPLEAGLSNSNFLFEGVVLSSEVDNRIPQKMVLRMNSDHSDSMCCREDELNCWQLALEQDCAPALYWVSEDERYYVSEYIEQTRSIWARLERNRATDVIVRAMENNESSFRNDQAQASIANFEGAEPEKKLLSLFTALSQLPTPDNEMSVRQQWVIYKTRLEIAAEKSNDTEYGMWLDAWQKLADFNLHIESWLQGMEACLIRPQYCHRDLNPHNLLLKDGKLYCIDFEYACASHPLFDLASILATHNLNSDQIQYLITQVLRSNPNMNDEAGNAIPAALNLFWLFACAWALLMAAESGNGSQQLTYLAWFDEYLNYLS